MIRLKVPTHSVDRGGSLVPQTDDAWDMDLVIADALAAEAQALAPMQDAIEAKYRASHNATDEEIAVLRESCSLSEKQRIAAHATTPYHRYQSGETRYDLDCADTAPDGSTCTVRGRYLTKGTPTIFRLRRLPYRDYNAAEELGDTRERLLEFCRLGLRAIDSPDGFKWQSKDGVKRVPEEIMQQLHDADVSLPGAIGTAVILLCRKLSKAELFR